ncbi:unnamed protein product [Paramecium sonneborni]|uniref:Uncharacterized protein n=1 Tax=Paramecium sonneborni TaxID=65129 RepID=A0A8S1PW49_9CILI|nr:unnamed protein product [Paramecium sonneborni]
MNTLSSNPKKTMFYAAAQNMLNQHSSYSSVQILQRSLLQLHQLPTINNQRHQLSQSLNNYSDRVQYNLSLPQNTNIVLQDRDRSLSQKTNNSINLNISLERLQNTQNIKSNFLIPNQNSNLNYDKEIQKQQLKAYLLKQIQEKQISYQQEQERIKIEDRIAEELNQIKVQIRYFQKRQFLVDILLYKKNLQLSKKYRNVSKLSLSPHQDGLFMQIQKSKFIHNNQQNDLLQKLSNIQVTIPLILQNNINNLQQSQSKQNHASSVRKNIKQMIRKTCQLLPAHNELIYENIHNQFNDKKLECETIFIPVNSKLNTSIYTSQSQPPFQIQQDINKSTHNFNQNNSFQLPQHNNSMISNPINNAQNYSSQINNINRINNHYRLTIHQQTSKERSISISNEKMLIKVDEIKDDIQGLTQKIKKVYKLPLNFQPIQNNLQLKLPHRTTMLMQITSKNQNQVQKQEEPKSSQRN